MIDGAMQDFALTLDKFLDHAAKWHPTAEVVTGGEGGGIDRVSYAELKARSLRISANLRDLGIEPGDRVATLAWNTQAHVEAWYCGWWRADAACADGETRAISGRVSTDELGHDRIIALWDDVATERSATVGCSVGSARCWC